MCLLVPGVSVKACGDRFVATSTEPWLDAVDFDVSTFAGRLVELTYRASFLDEPARPVFRFTTADGDRTDHIGAAPIAGAAVWIGRIPLGANHLAISPTNRTGPFSFVVDRIRLRSWLGVIAAGMLRRPRQTVSAILTRCIGWAPESDNNLAWAIGATDFGGYRAWRSRRTRPMQPQDFDAPRFDWSTEPPVRILVTPTGHDGDIERTLASLRAQAFDRWQVWIIGLSPAQPAIDDPRIIALDVDTAVERLSRSDLEGGGTLVASIEAGDTLPPYALALLVEQRRRHPEVRVLYGDEAMSGCPVLKPGWCSRLAANRPYLGRAVFAVGLHTWSPDDRRRFISAADLPAAMTQLGAASVRPLRRIMLERSRADDAPPAPVPPARAPHEGRAAIIILTRDHPALLSRAVESIRGRSPPGRYRIVLVDNGDPGGPATDLIATLARSPDVLLLPRPGPFNFSRFCNEAATACDEPLLVFLNDDTEVLSDGWLERLGSSANEPTVGAVGAKLTFPDGHIQHIGVLVGMGGSAGHLGAMAPADDPGWLGRNQVLHEVSAVTGACLAVARDKFAAVGGFDAEHLPIELSDVDLCLKLNARGWQTVVDPNVRLLHEESASRGGATFRRLDKYSRERDIFIDRWRHVLRDDPAFHPGLSLYSLNAALG